MNRQKSTETAEHIAMKGGGYYSAHTKGAKDVIDGAEHLVMEALESLKIADTSLPFAIADYGAVLDQFTDQDHCNVVSDS